MVGNDRRDFERLRLAKPILALLDGQNALILDIGISGAFVEHYGLTNRGDRFTLLFRWKGTDVEFEKEDWQKIVQATKLFFTSLAANV